MANVKIKDLPVIADPASTDVLPIVDVTLDTTNKISIADILKTAPEGTAAAPAIAFEGDSNTGIYHPGSEQIGFATSGIGRVFIASDGNVGIGATSPGQILTVENNNNPAILLNNSNSSNASSRSSRVALNVGGSFAAGIRASVPASGTASDADLQFGSGGDTTFSRMVIDSDGRVGIGTTNPGRELEVDGAIESSSTIYGVTFAGTNDTNSFIRFPGSDVIEFYNGNTESARIDGSGRLLVGTSSPITVNSEAGGAQTDTFGIQSVGRSNSSSLLLAAFPDSTSNARGSTFALVRSNGDEAVQTIVAEDNDLGSISFQGSDGTNFVRAANIKVAVDGTPGVDDMPGRIVFSTTAATEDTPTERVRINNAGQVLIAGSGTSSSPAIAIGGDENSGLYSPGPDQLAISTNGTGALFVDSSGQIGIGVTDPEAHLHIKSNQNTELRIEDQGEYVSLIYNDNGNTISVGVLNADSGNTSVADTELRIGVDGANRYVTKADGSHTFYQTDGSTESLTITSDGKLGLGFSSPGEKLDVNGKIKATDINFTGLATYADDSAAGTGGLVTGDVYKTSTGELRIKL